MIDVYQLQQQLLDAWRQVGMVPSGESVRKNLSSIPVFVKIDTHLMKVSGVSIQDNQIILETD